MQVKYSSSPHAFLRAVGSFLDKDIPRNQLVLAVSQQAAEQPDVYLEYHAWWVEDLDRVLAVASCTTPYNYLIGHATSIEAVDTIADAIVSSGVNAPGFIGNLPEVTGFAEAWFRNTGRQATAVMRQGVFGLAGVSDMSLADGMMRTAESPDRELLLRWWRAFIDEAVPDQAVAHEVAESRVDQRLDPLRPQGIDVWVVEEEIVAMSGYSIPIGNSIRIGPVYTPPDLRGSGYASALVHTQSWAMLDAGRTWCLLYTDLANPTSNRIYERIGYRQVAESAVYEF